MNVKQLKKLLEKFDENTKVMFSYDDHTGYLYKVDLTKDDIYLDDIACDNMDDELLDNKKLFNNEYDYIGKEVLIFNLDLNS
jgi:hypothetical protein